MMCSLLGCAGDLHWHYHGLCTCAAGDGGMVAAFEGLTVLEGTANNIKEAWRR